MYLDAACGSSLMIRRLRGGQPMPEADGEAHMHTWRSTFRLQCPVCGGRVALGHMWELSDYEESSGFTFTSCCGAGSMLVLPPGPLCQEERRIRCLMGTTCARRIVVDWSKPRPPAPSGNARAGIWSDERRCSAMVRGRGGTICSTICSTIGSTTGLSPRIHFHATAA
jgi:hypothetical protein